MSEQPRALRLADWIGRAAAATSGTAWGNNCRETAEELRQLSETKAELLLALKALRMRLIECSKNDAISARDAYDSFYQEVVDSAIAAATGEQT